MELLYCPFGMENGFTNPFASDFRMTSLESVLKNRANGTEATESEQAVTQKRKEVIIRGVLSVTVISAEDLPATDLVGKSDPYVVLTMKKSGMKNKTRVMLLCLKLRSFVFEHIDLEVTLLTISFSLCDLELKIASSRSLILRFIFQVVNESLNPIWNQTFDFVVEDGLHDMLIVEVWDHDTFGKVRHHSIMIGYFSNLILSLELPCLTPESSRPHD